jgi:hypothetical protein
MRDMKSIHTETARKAREGYMVEVKNRREREAATQRAKLLVEKLWRPVDTTLVSGLASQEVPSGLDRV